MAGYPDYYPVIEPDPLNLANRIQLYGSGSGSRSGPVRALLWGPVDAVVAAYLEGSWEMVATETSLAEGRPEERGVSTPSSYSGGSSLWGRVSCRQEGHLQRRVGAPPGGLLQVVACSIQRPVLLHLLAGNGSNVGPLGKCHLEQEVGGAGQVSWIGEPFRENVGRANLPWSLSRLKLATSWLDVSMPSWDYLVFNRNV